MPFTFCWKWCKIITKRGIPETGWGAAMHSARFWYVRIIIFMEALMPFQGG